MKHFLLGVGTTLAVLVVGVFVLLLVLGSGGGDPVAAPSPTASSPVPQPPDDLTAEETWLSSVDLRSADVVSADGDLADVVASGTGVRFSPTALRAQRLDLDATVPFATVAAEVGQDVRIYDAGKGGRAGDRAHSVTVLGRELTIRATGTVERGRRPAAHRARDHRPRWPGVPRQHGERPGATPRDHPPGRRRACRRACRSPTSR